MSIAYNLEIENNNLVKIIKKIFYIFKYKLYKIILIHIYP